MELDNRIKELKDFIYRKHSLELKLNELNEYYFYLKDHLRELIFKLEDNDININLLNKTSLIYMWYDIFTSKGKSISKMEYEYKLFSNLIDYIYLELKEIKNKLGKISEYEIEYKKLVEEKDKLLLDSEKNKEEELQTINKEIIKYKNRIRDINEAINSGSYLNNAFKQLLNLLKKTKDWDNLDIFGRGLFMSLTKTTVFKQTDERIKKLHYLANKFVRDLKIINFYTDIEINIGTVKKRIDYFETQLYDDLCDRKRLLNIIEYIKDSYQTIDKIVNTLLINKEKYLKNIIELQKNN